ncbi:FAD linked oxidase [Lasiodiplodia theobromae]|uniref:Delta(24)-sterol reductase n=1 Tax=Lasiodiplodia theobromae TaxID=45133 RepID=A0A8H7IRN3_9PEZI|nr:FAD linked oxidase [Lasiodiplodia theobromae]
MEEHEKQVAAISAKVRSFREQGVKFRISHGSTNSTRPSATRRDHNVIDLSALSRVLKVDKESRTAWVEPNVPMDRLVEETLKYGLVPPVVMEFPGITVGGGYAGTSGESSSFKHGFFNRTINWVEMILASGEVVRCSRTERADLFHGAAGAAGSLGTTTLVELRLKEAKKFVETTYHPVSSVAEAVAKCRTLIEDPTLEYVDGILFSKTHGAIITGRLTDSPADGVPIQCFSDAKDPWFYFHVKERTRAKSESITEAIPLAEYLFRYDRGGFWVGESAFDYFYFPFNDFTRWFLDDFLHTRMLYTALHASGQSKQFVVQDLALPFSSAEQFIDYTSDDLGIWPLWLCPLKQSPAPTLHPHNFNMVEAGDGTTLQPLLNVGVWGKGPTNHDAFVELNRKLEDKVHELGGMKWLYAHTYYAEDDFWKDFDRGWYEGLREKYGATSSLPSLYEKVRVDVDAEKSMIASSWPMYVRETWPVSGIWAIAKAIQSGTYLQARNSTWKWRR